MVDLSVEESRTKVIMRFRNEMPSNYHFRFKNLYFSARFSRSQDSGLPNQLLYSTCFVTCLKILFINLQRCKIYL